MSLTEKIKMKLTILKGLPASGKSTLAEEIIRSSGNTVRINKDLLRKMLHFDKFTWQNEQITREMSRSLAQILLGTDRNVIIDDTNLNPGTLQSWKDLGKGVNAKIEVINVDTPWQECVLRDAKRENSVGASVIKNMALQYGMFDGGKYVLCDIDGTIADCRHRQHHVRDGKRDWKSFFADMDKDTVKGDVRKILIDLYNQMYTIIFVSARPEEYRETTLKWLEENNLSFAFTLLMRANGDTREDSIVKKEILDRYFPDKSKIHKVLDDRPQVIRMWRENGLDVLDCGDGVEF